MIIYYPHVSAHGSSVEDHYVSTQSTVVKRTAAAHLPAVFLFTYPVSNPFEITTLTTNVSLLIFCGFVSYFKSYVVPREEALHHSDTMGATSMETTTIDEQFNDRPEVLNIFTVIFLFMFWTTSLSHTAFHQITAVKQYCMKKEKPKTELVTGF